MSFDPNKSRTKHTEKCHYVFIHREQRSQIRQQIRSIFTAQIDLVGAKLQMFNIHDLMTRNAILFHLGDDPFTPGGLGVFFGKRSFPNEARICFLPFRII